MKLPLMALLLLIWPFSSGKEYHMTAGNIVPAANGRVKVQKDLDGNSGLDIKVSKLADAPDAFGKQICRVDSSQRRKTAETGRAQCQQPLERRTADDRHLEGL